MHIRWTTISIALFALAMLASGCGRMSARHVSDVKKSDREASQLAGNTHRPGGGKPLDAAEAAEEYERACEQGKGAGCHDLGVMYQDGKGVPKNEVKAFVLFQKACAAHEPKGCFMAGKYYLHGRAVSQNLAKGTELFREACAGGAMGGCGELGALELIETLCLSILPINSWEVCEVAHLYLEQPGIKIDVARGVGLVEKACAGGYGDACNVLATCHRYGVNGLLPDIARMTTLNQKACDLGSLSGCQDVAWPYLASDKVKDKELAIELLRKGCTAQFGPSCNALGDAYLYGDGVPKDESQAAIYLEKGCDLHSVFACMRLAGLYDDGTGIARDVDKATRLYEKACARNYPPACDAINSPFRPSGVP